MQRRGATDGERTAPPVPDHWMRAILKSDAVSPAVRRKARARAGIGARIPPDAVTQDDEARLLDALAEESGDTLCGLRVGLRTDPNGGSVLVYICLSSITLGHLLNSAERYIRLTRPMMRVTLRGTPEAVFFEFSNRDPRLDLSVQYVEFVLGAVVNLLRVATGSQDLPQEAFLPHQRADRREEAAALLGCPVTFGAPRAGLAVSTATVSRRVVSGDAALHRHLRSYGDLLLRERAEAAPRLRYAAEAAILAALPSGTVTLARVAGELGVSPRTLRRRLGEEGLTFRGLVDDLRRILARSYLADAGIALADVAFLLGFADQSTFTTAHRRWTGETPARLRARLTR